MWLLCRYLAEVWQRWNACQCCTCTHPASLMRIATQEHEPYHDCLVHDIICATCFEFIPNSDVPFCPRSRKKNVLEIPPIPDCLRLGFLEQRAVSIMHCYVSILIIRGHQSAMKGQVVHCETDFVENIGKRQQMSYYQKYCNLCFLQVTYYLSRSVTNSWQ